MFTFVSINSNAWLILCTIFFMGRAIILHLISRVSMVTNLGVKRTLFHTFTSSPRPPSHDREDAKYSTKNYTVLDRSSKIALRSGSRRVCVDLQDWREWPNTVHKRQKQRFWWRNERLCYLLKPVHAPYPFRPCFLRILST